jgi:hypothetical protein
MDWLLWLISGVYLYVGAAQAARNISRGMVGSAGPVVTFVVVTLLWPVMPRA